MKAEYPRLESLKTVQFDGEEMRYELTLDPTVKDHRIIALIIDHTSKQGECSFYKPDERGKQCSIAPRFRVMWDDCEGKCFTSGLTCPIILEHIENLSDSRISGNNIQEAVAKPPNPS